ncbi:uncharacterized protein LTR77_004919 [Saxophila tyrrhenica]|uniref:Uncharacterized protein n=1 Tax=Saxophila tyrrhenica TaxID=1690608 RepID=A0AAV9PDY1_9PEZI|nr:hypothetical protein LTR77_004919 [Saxophila tyrrhenica]
MADSAHPGEKLDQRSNAEIAANFERLRKILRKECDEAGEKIARNFASLEAAFAIVARAYKGDGKDEYIINGTARDISEEVAAPRRGAGTWEEFWRVVEEMAVELMASDFSEAKWKMLVGKYFKLSEAPAAHDDGTVQPEGSS